MKKQIIVFLATFCLLGITSCGKTLQEPVPFVEDKPTSEGDSLEAYADFLAGDRTLLEEGQSEIWWIPDFQDESMDYEYTYLDLDGDDGMELLIQMADDPCSYNAVFHFENGRLFCWNSDASEMTCWDYPLKDGKMIRQYDTNGSRIYTIFCYGADGEKKDINQLFMREELSLQDDSLESYPYYEVGGEQVEKAAFYEKLGALVTDYMLERSAWIEI